MTIDTVYRGHTEPAGYDFARAGLDAVLATLGAG
jgi:sulfur relay (sulfurtransferase) DsrF/TusC family protein